MILGDVFEFGGREENLLGLHVGGGGIFRTRRAPVERKIV